MYDVELLGAGYYAGYYRVVVDLLVQVVGIASGELYATQIVGIEIAEIGVDVVTETVVVL